MAPTSTTLKINLTEPVVILPALETSEYDHATLKPNSYAVRGLLELNLSKPTRITSIEVDLTCRTMTAWPDGTLHDGQALSGVEQNILYVQNERLFDMNTDTSRGRSILREDRDSPPYTPSPTGSGNVSASGSRAPSASVSARASRAPSGSRIRSPMMSRQPSASGSRTPTTPIERIGRFLGLESANSLLEGTLFEPGTYTYPIFLKVPLHLPQTVKPPAQPASVTWIVSARVGRSGKKKLSNVHEIQVVRAPPDSELDMVNTIERNWEDQLRYKIVVPPHEKMSEGGGDGCGTLPLELTLIPLEKVKIVKLSVSLEERIGFYTKGRKLVRRGKPKFISILCLEHPDGITPLLPLTDDDSDTLIHKSPLAKLLDPNEDPRTSSLMGTGPWVIKKEFKLSSPLLSATHANQTSNVDIAHSLKIIIRVRKSDAPALYDVAIEIPYGLVSDRLSSERSRLPEYTPDYILCSSSQPTSPTNHLARWAGFGTEEQQLEWHMRFERLMSGREDPAGDVPPAYERQNSA